MYKFRQEFFDYLTKRENFHIESYRSEYRNSEEWMAIRRFEQGLFAVIITDDKGEGIDFKEAIDYLNGKGEPYSLHTIVLSNGDYINGGIYIPSKLVVDSRTMRISYCDPDCKQLSSIVEGIISSRLSPKGKMDKIKPYYLTYTLIGLNIIMYIISAVMAKNIMDIDAITLIKLGGKYTPLIYLGEWWRLITCNFLHGGLIHLAFNMYALYIIGYQIEMVYGRVKYIIIYAASGIGSSLLSYYLAPRTLSIGASGAIFGLMGALLVYAYKERGRLQKGVISNLLSVIAINLFIGLSMSNIDNFGHIGGLVVGLIISFILYTLPIKNKEAI